MGFYLLQSKSEVFDSFQKIFGLWRKSVIYFNQNLTIWFREKRGGQNWLFNIANVLFLVMFPIKRDFFVMIRTSNVFQYPRMWFFSKRGVSFSIIVNLHLLSPFYMIRCTAWESYLGCCSLSSLCKTNRMQMGVHSIKLKYDGSLDQYKAQLVALGNRQECGECLHL